MIRIADQVEVESHFVAVEVQVSRGAAVLGFRCAAVCGFLFDMPSARTYLNAYDHDGLYNKW
jgi:hypothetical protein